MESEVDISRTAMIAIPKTLYIGIKKIYNQKNISSIEPKFQNEN